MRNVAGIYLITVRRPDGAPLYYVGQSHGMARRVRDHMSALRRGKHVNPYMQSAYAKYGEIAFYSFELEECEPDGLDAVEQWWLDEMVGHGRVLNLGLAATSGMRGRRHTDATRAVMSAKKAGWTPSAALLDAARKANVGRVMSSESSEKKSAAQKGRVLSDAHRAKLSRAKSGKPQAQAHRDAISKSLMGEKHPLFGVRGANHPLSKPIEGVHVETGALIRFASTRDAEKDGFSSSCISQVCNGKLKTHKRYTWRFAGVT